MRGYTKIDDDESIWRVEFNTDDQYYPVYVIAPNEIGVHVVLGRMYGEEDGFDWEDNVVTRSHYTDIEDAVRGDEPPYSSFEAKPYQIVEHEKRVNQAGFKGVYQRTHRR